MSNTDRPTRPESWPAYYQGPDHYRKPEADAYMNALEAESRDWRARYLEAADILKTRVVEQSWLTKRIAELEAGRSAAIQSWETEHDRVTELVTENRELLGTCVKHVRRITELEADLKESNDTISTLGFGRAKARITELECALREARVYINGESYGYADDEIQEGPDAVLQTIEAALSGEQTT